MTRTTRAEKDPIRGERFRAICQALFAGRSRSEMGRVLGVSSGAIRNGEQGYPLSAEAIGSLEAHGASMAYLLRGEGSPLVAIPQEPSGTKATEASSPTEAPVVAVDPGDPKWVARAIGANLRHFQKKMFPGWGGQKRFAEFLGLAANDLCVYEYGRIVPNESRQEEIARRLGLTPEQLRTPLPGVVVSPPTAVARSDAAWQVRTEELQRSLARMEGRLEAMQEELIRQREQTERLREANIVLRHLLYGDDSPEARARRERVVECLAPSIADLVGQGNDY